MILFNSLTSLWSSDIFGSSLGASVPTPSLSNSD
nr:MAG TPA: hypothetical protein [Caudoviricetes sp.]